MYSWFYRTLLVQTDPERAHNIAIAAIRLAGIFPPVAHILRTTIGRRGVRRIPPQNEGGPFARPVPGVLGLAAGMDKDAEAILGLDALGFGFIEIGTVTAQAQPGNESPRLWRLPQLKAFRNRMGFNNSGAAAAGRKLKKLRSTARGRAVIVGANIGKTKVTPLEDAVGDYVSSTREIAKWVDFIVVNVSSPNTPGLRDLQSVSALRPILEAVQAEAKKIARREVPVLVKIAPDLSNEEIDAVSDLVIEIGLRGVVATNTTIQHDFGPGGISGLPLQKRSLEMVRRLRQHLGTTPLIIGVGGIFDEADARAMRDAGADLLESFTGFVYQGPSWPGRINRALSKYTPWPES